MFPNIDHQPNVLCAARWDNRMFQRYNSHFSCLLVGGSETRTQLEF